MGDAQVVSVGGSIGKKDSILGINEGCGVIQGDLPASVILAVSAFSTESPMVEGVYVHVVFPSTWDKVVEGMRMWIGVHQ